MREIKFRAWDKKLKEMASVVCLNLGDLVVLMQFTGLHDKNGKEIYEGDILEIHHHYYGKTKTKVEFVAGMFQQYPMEKGMISTPLNQITLNCEIIGNKFENPELLGGAS